MADELPPHAPSLTKGTWRPLVRAGAKWVLTSDDTPPVTLTVETYDVRKIGKADVARLRWTLVNKWGAQPLKAVDLDAGGRPTQIAVGDAGVWFLSADADDKAVAAAMKTKPTFTDPPRLAHHKNGNFIEQDQVGQNWMLCWGYYPPPSAGDCNEGVCDAKACIAERGLVYIYGMWGEENILAAEGYLR